MRQRALYRHGIANDVQRYRCCACGRTFNDLTGTPLARLRLEAKWLAYAQALLDSLPVRKAADRVGVHRNTAFRWRHRFLLWVRLDGPALLNGIVEADETCLLESQKGSRALDRPPRRRGGRVAKPGISSELDCILVARHREGRTVDAVTGRGHLKAVRLERDLLVRKHRIAHETVNPRARARVRRLGNLAIHVQNVNAYCQRFKTWLQGFRGVASRYLPNCLGWRQALDGERVASPEQLLRIAISVINRKF